MPRIGSDGKEYSARLKVGLYFWLGLSATVTDQLHAVLPVQRWDDDKKDVLPDDSRLCFKDNKNRNAALDRCLKLINESPDFPDRALAAKAVQALRRSSSKTYYHYIMKLDKTNDL